MTRIPAASISRLTRKRGFSPSVLVVFERLAADKLPPPTLDVFACAGPGEVLALLPASPPPPPPARLDLPLQSSTPWIDLLFSAIAAGLRLPFSKNKSYTSSTYEKKRQRKHSKALLVHEASRELLSFSSRLQLREGRFL